MENNKSSRIHPLVAGAAISVMLVSLTGVAALTGLIPSSHSTAAPAAVTASAPVPAAATEQKAETEAAAPQAKAAPEKPRSHAPRTAHASEPQRVHSSAPAKVAQAPAVCQSCGRVEAVEEVQQAAQPSGVGMVAGAVLGGVLGNQVGGGNGRKLATVAGAIGGGYAGNEVEKRTRTSTTYNVRVRMEDGEVRTFPYAQQPAWSVGDRVKVVNGQLAARA